MPNAEVEKNNYIRKLEKENGNGLFQLQSIRSLIKDLGVGGIIQVYHSGQWGTVCDYYDYFDMRDAKVACRQLGYSKTVGYWQNGRGTGKVWLQYMQCTGSESSLGSCTHNGWGSVSSSCNGHTYDVGVVLCQGTVCHYGYTWDINEEVKVACRQLGFTKAIGPLYFGQGTGKIWLNGMGCTGSEASLGSCSHRGWGSVGSHCNSHTYDVGVVTIFKKGESTNCFTQLDFGGDAAWKTHETATKEISSTRFNRKINVSAALYKSTTVVNGEHGQWGTVCEGYFDMNDAKVACRQLGFSKTVGYWYFGRGTGKVWLNNMQCTGSESSLGSCSHNGWGSVASYCNSHTYDGVSVDMLGLTVKYMKVVGTFTMLVFFFSSSEALLSNFQIKFQIGYRNIKFSVGEGTVCHYGYTWDINEEVKVACGQFGFAKAIGPWYFGQGTGEIWLNSMGCTGSESSLGSCSHRGWETLTPTATVTRMMLVLGCVVF
ncbi:deleted in malignant brain tumors 1 protein-like [Actinia tenebrosa]|uniref:Deleted in malignant brain tumors 1 protein-like n=1 Tax=Actinia tenebrosa TaxID=6105 RepID=A0A6P8IVT7_ACTTE|nr:deleted in malignant brain tumors 1 protein-like [Actinia tenebrosa]